MTERVTPKQPRAQATKALILETATALYEEMGLGLTTQAVSSRSGVSIGTIYRYFPSRVDLLQQVIPAVDAVEAPASSLTDEQLSKLAEHQAMSEAFDAIKKWAMRLEAKGEGKGDLKVAGAAILKIMADKNL